MDCGNDVYFQKGLKWLGRENTCNTAIGITGLHILRLSAPDCLWHSQTTRVASRGKETSVTCDHRVFSEERMMKKTFGLLPIEAGENRAEGLLQRRGLERSGSARERGRHRAMAGLRFWERKCGRERSLFLCCFASEFVMSGLSCFPTKTISKLHTSLICYKVVFNSRMH